MSIFNSKLKTIGLISIFAVSAIIVTSTVVLMTSKQRLKLSTTTSTEDSGLLDYLLVDFEREYGCDVEVIAAGTGAAIENAKNGNADLVLVHARDLELEFVDEGYGYHRATFMYNDFVLVGPSDDPLDLSSSANDNITQALETFWSNTNDSIKFVSRGDNSGTNIKEITIWNETSVKNHPNPAVNKWYMETGAGMGNTLIYANDIVGYTISDRATWYKMESSLQNLKIVVENDPSGILLNPYSFIQINETRYPHVNQELAKRFVAYCLSEQGQERISNYRIEEKPLFHPCWDINSSISILNSNPVDVTYWNGIINQYYPANS
ncbi:MAG: substrate-binding domain-containing protein [Promethearchaeota archaeon]